MKRNKILNKLFYSLVVPAFLLACDDESGSEVAPIDFSSIATTYQEADGTVTIPFRGAANTADLDFEFGGTAVEGEDFEFVGVSAEGVQVKIIDDVDREPIETIRILMTSSNLNLTGNNTHTISVVSSCDDIVGLDASYFVGTYAATERYGPNPPASNWYGPYTMVITQDATNPNRLNMTNFYDAGRTAYIVFDVEAGTVKFPEQTPLPDTSPNLLTASTGTFTVQDPCNLGATLTISLDYDGGVWEYYFEK